MVQFDIHFKRICPLVQAIEDVEKHGGKLLDDDKLLQQFILRCEVPKENLESLFSKFDPKDIEKLSRLDSE